MVIVSLTTFLFRTLRSLTGDFSGTTESINSEPEIGAALEGGS